MTAKGFFGEADDLEWKRFVVKVIQKSEATVIPMFFHGQNSWLFQFVSQFSLTVRLSILLWEAVNKIGKTFRIEIGDPIPYSELKDIKNRQAVLDYLKTKTFELR